MSVIFAFILLTLLAPPAQPAAKPIIVLMMKTLTNPFFIAKEQGLALITLRRRWPLQYFPVTQRLSKNSPLILKKSLALNPPKPARDQLYDKDKVRQPDQICHDSSA